MARHIPDPPGIGTARTLPAAWYASDQRWQAERRHVFGDDWVCVGVTDELPAAGAWTAVTVGGTPVLVVRDREGVVRAFLNVCRHRAAPLCDVGATGEGSLIRCPYHSWLYRLDGTLARASGVGEPDDFRLDEHSLREVAVHVWRRTVFVHLGAEPAAFDAGPLGAAIDAFPIEDFELELAEGHDRHFDWKVLLENYSENYHTPFVHPEIDTTSSEDYPMVSDGRVLYAWDRPLRPAADDRSQQIMASLLPGEPGWEQLAEADPDRPYGVGSYLTVWPNLMMNVFPDAALVMWMEPQGAGRARVERRLYVAAHLDAPTRRRIVDTHALVHQQDVDICHAVQRSHDAGLDADGRLATVEERGVFFVHEHLRAAVPE
jgi:phenylpropionate dioxygenase-like ring-hydroxylating dioxygenase large terminal subunit